MAVLLVGLAVGAYFFRFQGLPEMDQAAYDRFVAAGAAGGFELDDVAQTQDKIVKLPDGFDGAICQTWIAKYNSHHIAGFNATSKDDAYSITVRVWDSKENAEESRELGQDCTGFRRSSTFVEERNWDIEGGEAWEGTYGDGLRYLDVRLKNLNFYVEFKDSEADIDADDVVGQLRAEYEAAVS